jgi:hypothetical protein
LIFNTRLLPERNIRALVSASVEDGADCEGAPDCGVISIFLGIPVTSFITIDPPPDPRGEAIESGFCGSRPDADNLEDGRELVPPPIREAVAGWSFPSAAFRLFTIIA